VDSTDKIIFGHKHQKEEKCRYFLLQNTGTINESKSTNPIPQVLSLLLFSLVSVWVEEASFLCISSIFVLISAICCLSTHQTSHVISILPHSFVYIFTANSAFYCNVGSYERAVVLLVLWEFLDVRITKIIQRNLKYKVTVNYPNLMQKLLNPHPYQSRERGYPNESR